MRMRVNIEQIFDKCRKHIERIEFAKANMKELLPLTVSKYENLENEQIVYIDQYLFRFSKLQDTIGKKLITALFELLGESIQNMSFRDIFDRLEQIGVIKDFDKWNDLIEIRNELSHEYEDDLAENVEKLNIILKMDKELIRYFNSIEKYYSKKLLKKNKIIRYTK